MKTRFALLFSLLFLSTSFCLVAQRIAAGPMPGYTTMREAGVWLQLDREARVHIEYWDTENPAQKAVTDEVLCPKQNAFTARFVIGGLEPGKTYAYRVLAGKNDLSAALGELTFRTQALWQFRTDPPDFKVVMGSCAYINEAAYDRPDRNYGGDYAIFERMADQRPDLMLWLGDNVYLREADWDSRSGILHRYSHTRATPEMQRLLRTTHHYAIWDDHDFGPNDANGSWPHKDLSLEAFSLFWMNPTTGVPGVGGITTAFRFNDMDFYLLDNRYHRSFDRLKSGQTQILGTAQIEWLIAAMKQSRAPFKLVAVGGQVLNTAAVFETHAVYAREREYLIKRIAEEGISGVVFLTGDRHHTEMSRLDTAGITLYDITGSPLTSSPHKADDESNAARVEGTMVNQRNFTTLEFNGPRKARQMKVSTYAADGSLLWEQVVKP